MPFSNNANNNSTHFTAQAPLIIQAEPGFKANSTLLSSSGSRLSSPPSDTSDSKIDDALIDTKMLPEPDQDSPNILDEDSNDLKNHEELKNNVRSSFKEPRDTNNIQDSHMLFSSISNSDNSLTSLEDKPAKKKAKKAKKSIRTCGCSTIVPRN